MGGAREKGRKGTNLEDVNLGLVGLLHERHLPREPGSLPRGRRRREKRKLRGGVRGACSCSLVVLRILVMCGDEGRKVSEAREKGERERGRR